MPFDTWESSIPEPFTVPKRWIGAWNFVAESRTDDAVLQAHFGPHHEVGVLEGIGDARYWTLRYPCGCELGIEFTDGLGGPGFSVRSNDPDLAHALHHFGLPVDWRRDEDPAPRVLPVERWSLFRQDDNGGRFHIRDFDSKFSAECARRTFEARGHKQLYTIEKG